MALAVDLPLLELHSDSGESVPGRRPGDGRDAPRGAADGRRRDAIARSPRPRRRCPRGARLLAKERARILRRWADLMLEHETELATLLTTEQGKPLAESRAEIGYAASFLEWFGEEAKRVYGDTIPSYARDRRVVVAEAADRRHGRDHALELPRRDGHAQGRARRSRPAARWC